MPATAEDLTAILRLDTEVFGLDRTHMITRLPAFADQLRVAEENGGSRATRRPGRTWTPMSSVH